MATPENTMGTPENTMATPEATTTSTETTTAARVLNGFGNPLQQKPKLLSQ